MKQMLFYGASGHAKVLIDSWLSMEGSVSGIFDDNPEIGELLGYPVIGKYAQEYLLKIPLIISIGSNTVRCRLTKMINHTYGNVIHKYAIVSMHSNLGAGIAVMAGAVINAGSTIGNHSIVNTGAVVDHDCMINDFTHIAPGAILCGGVTIGEGTLVGAGATVLPGIEIGKWSIIGAGSVVNRDVPDYSTMAGVPAKLLKSNRTKANF